MLDPLKNRLNLMSRSFTVLLLTWTILIIASLASSPSVAQVGLGTDPMITYYQALQAYRDGDIENAIRGFEAAERGTRTDPSGKWIDAIPARVMLAECYWQLGHLPACQANLDAATGIAIRHQGWIGSLDFSVLNTAPQVAAPGNLWPEVAAVQILSVPNRIPVHIGQAVTEQSLAAGGVITPPNIKNLDAIEIMRCLAVASHRRRVLLGPLAVDSTMGSELLEATKRPTGLNQPLAKSLLNAMRGCEYYATGEDKTAVDRANNYASPGGVHPLTPLSMLCALKVSTGGNDLGELNGDSRRSLVNTAQQIVNAAAALEQYEWIGEALQVAMGVADEAQLSRVEQTALMAGRTLVQRSRLASLHCYLVAADAAVSAGRVEPATEHLQTALALTGRRDIQLPRLQAYAAYVAARIAAKNGQSIGISMGSEMTSALTTMNDFILHGRNQRRPIMAMPFLHQVDIVMASMSGNVGNQSAKRILSAYASPAGIGLWRQDPLNALAAINFDDSALHAALLRLASLENDGIGVLKQTDRLLAKRFTSQLPLQGRLLQLRTLASASTDSMWPSVRQSMESPVPALKRVRELTQAAIIPPAPAPGDPAAAAASWGAARSLADAHLMEALLSDLSLARIAVPEVNPPRVATTDVDEIPDGTVLLTFLVDSGRIIASASRDGVTRTWVVPGANRLPAMVSRLLQDIGASQSRGKRLPDDDTQWKAAATKIRSYLFPADSGWSEDGLERVIVVPDGPLWYLPFELLPLADIAASNGEENAEPKPESRWADALDVQYAPTPGLALRNADGATSADQIAMVAGNFFAVRDAQANEAMVRDVMQTADNAIISSLVASPATSNMGLNVGHLIVAAPITPNLKSPLSTQIIPLDSTSGQAAGRSDTLRDWVRLPASGPRTVFLPGLRTSAATSKLGDGSELFYPMISLQASGVREVGLSRWATGGASAAAVLSEVVNEVPYTSLAAAIRRGTMMLRQTELSLSREPLLGKADSEATEISGDEPLFWATYLSSGSLQLAPPTKED